MNSQRSSQPSSWLQPIVLTSLAFTALTIGPAPVQAIPQTPIETLKSDRLLDYEPLQTLLRSGQWTEAAAVTSNLMLKAGGQLEQGYLVEANIRYFPCNDLLTVDRLWRYYSRDRFGLSVQSHIWVSIGGKGPKDVSRFAGRVGWKTPIDTVTNPNQVPAGYFPLRPGSGGGVTEAWSGQWIAEMPKRLVKCQAPPKPVTKLNTPKKKPTVPAKPAKNPKS